MDGHRRDQGEPDALHTCEETGETAPAENLIELILCNQTNEKPTRIDGVVVGRIAAVGANGQPLVEFFESAASAPLPARTIAPVGESDVGREVALLFEGGDPMRPILMGMMYAAPSPFLQKPDGATIDAPPPAEPKPTVAEVPARANPTVDGERLVFSAEHEIVLRCGQASITLTRAGKVLIRGAYLLARSSGVNRIQGGSVQIN
jgi:hypothetical protein